MNTLKIPIAIIILVVLMATYIPPRESNAQAVQITKGIACTVGGIAAGWLTDQIFNGLKKIYMNLPLKVANFLGWGVLNFFFPSDVPVGDSRNNNKEHIGDVIARCFAAQILDKISRQTIAGIRTSGRNGGPAFVRDWRMFKLDAQRRGENLFRTILGSTELCPYFSGDIRTIFKANNQPPYDKINSRARVSNFDPFKTRATCTMPRNWSLNSYKTDFAGNGGWGALNKLAQPQNNFYGNLLMSLSEASIQRAAEEDSDMSSVVAGLGFDSRRGKNKADSCALADRTGQCIVYKDILTPGSYLQQSASALVQQELAWITSIDEINELIADLTTRLLFRVLDLSGSRPSSAVLDGDPPRESAPDLDHIYPDDPDQLPQCRDTIDNDGDTLTDYPDDPGCIDTSDDDELNFSLFCNGQDADNDGSTCDIGETISNCPADCTGIPVAECQNARDTNGDSIADTGDDDGDGLVDAPGLGWLNGPDPG